jgi:NhaC family Na+:H+ antiporter
VLFLIALLTASVYFFGEDASYGPNQIALILSAGVAALFAMRLGFKWKEIEKGIVDGIALATGALLILLVVGSLIGTWILSGIVPGMIYWGLQILHPSIFFVAACAISGLVSFATGSSWTTVSTIGIALIGIAGALDLSVAVAAGAIISGAYFGDKLSPLSDTTNLAPAMAGTDLFTHIRHMLWTTIPSISLALLLFLVIGFFGTGKEGTSELEPILDALSNSFEIRWYLLIPPAIVLFMVIRKTPAFPALLVGALVGGLFAFLFQQEAVLKYVGDTDLPRVLALVKGCWMSLFTGFTADTGNAQMDELLTRGGMQSMLDTVWLILSAMMFGGVMEKSGMLQTIANNILSYAKSTGSLVTSTLVTSIGMNIVASDQYIAIVVPGRMYRAEFKKRRLHPKNLSRCLEDAGTLTSPLVPWNTCGAFMAQNLSVPTLTYLPFCFSFYGFTGFTMEKLEQDEESEVEP